MMMMTILMMMMVVVLLWRFSHKRSQFGQTDILRKQNCNNCGRRSCWLSTLDLNKKKKVKQQQQQQQQKTKTRSSKTTAKLIKVYCILFSKQFFGWPYQPPQVYRCYCSGLHFPFHPPFDLSYRTPQPFIMLGYPAWASTLDTTVQKRWFFSPDQACLLQWNPVNPVTDE